MYEVIPLVIFVLVIIKTLTRGYQSLTCFLSVRPSTSRSRHNSRQASPIPSVSCNSLQDQKKVKKCSSLCKKPCEKLITPRCSSPESKSNSPQLSHCQSPIALQKIPKYPSLCKRQAKNHVYSQSSFQVLPECPRSNTCPIDHHSCFPRVAPTPSCSSKACIVDPGRIEGSPSSRSTCPQKKSHPDLTCEESRNIAVNTTDTFCTCLLVGNCKCDHDAMCPTLCVIDPKYSANSSKVSLCNNTDGNYTCERGTHYMICICDRKPQ